jgi:polyisoprenoid-binding protein YceI
MRTVLTAALVALGASAATASAAALFPWNVDAAHTEVNFQVRHFFTPVNGTFRDFDIQLDYDPENPGQSSVKAEIQVASVDTRNDRRDEHLRTADWFDAETWPTMTFESTSVRADGANRLVATGDLTIKDVTRQVELPIEILGVKDIPTEMREMLGGAHQVASFRADLRIDRGDFGVGTGQWAEDVVVGKDVDIEILVEANHQGT